MAWSKWIDLAMPKPELGSVPFDSPMPMASDEPRYPYGMRITLESACLEKADFEDVKVGDEIDVRAFGKVVRYEDDEGRRCMTIQLTKIKVENEDTEDEED